MVTTPVAPHAAPQGGKQAPLAPFRRGTQPTVYNTGWVQTNTLSTSTQDLPLWQIPPNNIIRCVYLEVTATTSGNTASVAFEGDAPLNIFSTVNFADASGTSIVGSFDSYTLAMITKYGGYGFNGDPRANAVYSVTTGTGATGGSFNVVFRIPVEIRSREGIGSLANQSTNSPLTLQLTLNKSTAVYSTAPTSQPSVVVTARLGGYWKGDNAAASQTPVAYGTTSYWNRATYLALNGSVTQQLQPIGLGNPLRNLMFINYATGSARSDSDFPDPMEVDFRGNKLLQISQNLWKYQMSEQYGLQSTTLDSANGLDTGVYVIPFTHDFGLQPGDELGNGYLSTNIGDSIQLVGSWGASSTLYEVINFLVPQGGSLTSIQAGA